MRKSVLAVAASASVFAMVVAGAAGFTGTAYTATSALNITTTGSVTTEVNQCSTALKGVSFSLDGNDTIDKVYIDLDTADCDGYDFSATITGTVDTTGKVYSISNATGAAQGGDFRYELSPATTNFAPEDGQVTAITVTP